MKVSLLLIQMLNNYMHRKWNWKLHGKKTDRLINSDCDVKVKRTSGPDK